MKNKILSFCSCLYCLISDSLQTKGYVVKIAGTFLVARSVDMALDATKLRLEQFERDRFLSPKWCRHRKFRTDKLLVKLASPLLLEKKEQWGIQDFPAGRDVN